MNDQVAVTYENAGDYAYVTLLGRAEVERDVDARRRYWREGGWLFLRQHRPLAGTASRHC